MPDARIKSQSWFQKLRWDTIDLIPTPLILALASPYLAGATSSTAIEFAHQQYHQSQLTSTLDILGESSISDQQCDQSVDKYLQLLNEISAHSLPVSTPIQQISVSLKPSTFSTIVPGSSVHNAQGYPQAELDTAYSRIERIVSHAQKLGINMTIEAEEHHWTDFHLSCYFSLIKQGYLNVGTVLQSRLLRTEQDVKKFDDKMRVRLVIGIYDEPSTIALTDKKDMKERLVEYGLKLAKQGSYVEFATHDLRCIEHFVQQTILPLRLTRQQFEFQFLKGVPRKPLQAELATGTYFYKLGTSDHLSGLAASGTTVRLYVPYGIAEHAAAYCKRRLKESPSIIAYGLKNLLHIQ